MGQEGFAGATSFGWRWSRQALGMAGVLLGWTPWLHGKVRRDAARALERFMASSR